MERLECEDYLYPSDNGYEIPCLRLDRQAGNLILPFAPYGAGRSTKEARTIHFYVDDYRFSSLWKKPAKIFTYQASAIVEPNYSIFDTTPLAIGIYHIYRKRWLARYYQECGLCVYADLNVSAKFTQINMKGIPPGYNAFATRGVCGRINDLERELSVARVISQKRTPNFIVYGGGATIRDFCIRNSLLYIPDFMTAKFGKND